jgi:uncharacterized protein YebE (UPF0316 family)
MDFSAFMTFMDSWVWKWIIMPILICLSRLLDVSLGTVRVIFVSKGLKKLAPILGFFEVFMWIVVASQVMRNSSNLLYYVAYAAGFAVGTYAGLNLDEKLSIGIIGIRIITNKKVTEILEALRSKNFGVTQLRGEGAFGPVDFLFTITDRVNIKNLTEIIKNIDPDIFYVIEDIRSVSYSGVFPKTLSNRKFLTQAFRPHRKGK